jgi:hypothetical protein
VAATLLLGAAAGTAEAAPSRGTLLSAVPISGYDRTHLATYLSEMNFGSPAPQNGADAYRLTYRTITPQGAATTATGTVVLPRAHSRSLRLVSYQHGTLTWKSGAASVDEGEDRAFSLYFGGAGYAVAAPDYLGLGQGPGQHPYMHSPSETTASVDMLRAARTFFLDHGHDVQRDVLATGFSQGGRAAMALGKALDSGADRYFRIGAIAPISGPYDVLGAELPAMADGSVNGYAGSFYLSYFIIAWNRLYHLYDNPSEAFKAPYDRTVEALFDGSHNEDEIIPALPPSYQDIIKPEFMAKLSHPTGELRRAMEQGDSSCAWHPRVPVELFAASGDTEVPIANARNCQQDLRAHGARVPLTDLGPTYGHRDTPLQAGADVLRLFASAA